MAPCLQTPRNGRTSRLSRFTHHSASIGAPPDHRCTCILHSMFPPCNCMPLMPGGVCQAPCSPSSETESSIKRDAQLLLRGISHGPGRSLLLLEPCKCMCTTCRCRTEAGMVRVWSLHQDDNQSHRTPGACCCMPSLVAACDLVALLQARSHPNRLTGGRSIPIQKLHTQRGSQRVSKHAPSKRFPANI